MKLFYNGIKTSDSQGLQKCHFSKPSAGGYTTAAIPEGTITIYKRDYVSFSKEVHDAFKVQNDTDITTDYIVKDIIRVMPSHPLYATVNAAWEAQEAKNMARAAKRLAA